MLNIPDGLPTLDSGCHDVGEGKACIMEYVSILAGEEFTDSPQCTHPRLAEAAREINDSLHDEDRHLLVPLIGRLFGTNETNDEIDAALNNALPFVEDCGCFTCRMCEWFEINPKAEDMVRLLSHLVDTYDKVSGRTEHHELSTDELRGLRHVVDASNGRGEAAAQAKAVAPAT